MYCAVYDSIVDQQLHWFVLQFQVLSCEHNCTKVLIVREPGIAVILRLVFH